MKSQLLSAMIGSHPLGALSSFGLLRIVSEVDPTARLAFVLKDDWIACIKSQMISSDEMLIELLVSWLNSNDLDQAFNWADDVRVSPEAYTESLRNALSAEQSTLVQFLSALVAGGAVDAQKGLVKPTAFYMVSGQQSFLGGLREILVQARKSPESILREALFGPWRYQTKAHSLGWDPNTERLYALRGRAPTSEKPSCVAGAMVLAFLALPMMPAVSSGGRPLTIGFSRVGREQRFSWPIFSTPIDSWELTTLLQAGPRGWRGVGERDLRSGIEAVYESSRFEFGQGYAVLKPARSNFAVHRPTSRSPDLPR